MQSAYDAAFERELGCTEAEWLRWLPDAIGTHPREIRLDSATVGIGAGTLLLRWHVQAPRVIASVQLPRLHVSFRFEGLSAQQRLAFMRRFDLHLQRGGG